MLVDGKPVSGSLFDFGLYFYHNAKTLARQQNGPFFYLPKLEHHLEARLWNDVFNFSQDRMGLSRGSVKATVLIETILAAFQMDEVGIPYCFGASRRSADDPWAFPPSQDLIRAEGPLSWPQLRQVGLHLLLHQEAQEQP